MSATPTGPTFGLPPTWIDYEDTLILFANHFLVQHEPNEFVLSLGQLSPPPVTGTPDEIREQVSEMSHVPVHTLSRVALTRQRVVELIGLLQATLEEHDRAA
jgi:hypothetical protein